LSKRRFLFLQGPATPFFARLADRLRADGHETFKVVFNGGDWAHWSPRSCWHYRDGLQSLRAFLDDRYRRFGISDQILFGDRRAVHQVAVEHGEACGVRTHVFEEGYFRPSWVTLEREGVNGHSLLPRDPDWFRGAAKALPDSADSVPIRSPFWVRAAHDVGYHLAGLLNPVCFDRYRTHAPVTAPVEYAAYARRFSRLRMIRNREYRRVAELVASAAPYFVLPLQLNSDAQIRDHSRFEHMGEVIVHVLESFARHAPGDARIVVKNHPLDLGLMDYRRIVADCERRFDLAGRTLYLEDGDMGALARHALGMVTVNSTVGIVALELGRPTATLSDPIYNLPGLTWQGGLDAFWTNGQSPDAQLYSSFRRVVMRATQVNGGFYCRQGIALAVQNSFPFLTAERSPLEELL
jgi:capsular polysaccharide export protein